ncbi:MAG: 16S rRNA (cytosine(1402)-N(4))-methyltransferase RsmH [Bacteroidales bacterium]
MPTVYHTPVMLFQTIEGLNIKPDGTYVDLTFGGGGHAREILAKLGKQGRLFAFDQDEDALQNTIEDARFTLINQNFQYLKNFLRMYAAIPVDGILADLGVSSHQFDVPERGFSIRTEGPLDMRMDKRQSLNAASILNEYTEEEISKVLYTYGELRDARRIAKAIVKARVDEKITNTAQLMQILNRFPARGKENKFYAMLFQALRIEVNQEIEALKVVLQQCLEILKPEGRLVVLSYHSLEDRLVKNFMRSAKFEGEIDKDFYGNSLSPFRLINRKAIVAQTEELDENSRARSAKLRIAEKI